MLSREASCITSDLFNGNSKSKLKKDNIRLLKFYSSDTYKIYLKDRKYFLLSESESTNRNYCLRDHTQIGSQHFFLYIYNFQQHKSLAFKRWTCSYDFARLTEGMLYNDFRIHFPPLETNCNRRVTLLRKMTFSKPMIYILKYQQKIRLKCKCTGLILLILLFKI